MGAELSSFDLAPENEGGVGGVGGVGGEDFELVELVEGNTDAARATRASIVANLAREVRGEGMAAMEAAREAKARAKAREENAKKAMRTASALEKMAITAKNVAAAKAAAKAAAATAGVPFREPIRNSNSSSSSSSSSFKSYSSFFSEQSDVDDPDLVSYGELMEAYGPTTVLSDEQNRNMMREDIEREIKQMKSDTNAWIRFELSKGKEPTFSSFKRKSSYTRDTRHRHRLNNGDWKKIFESSVDHILKETLF